MLATENPELAKLVGLVTGCRNDGDGIEAKRHIIAKHIESFPSDDLLQSMIHL